MSSSRTGQSSEEQFPLAWAFGRDVERASQLRAVFSHSCLDDEKAITLRMWLIALDKMSDKSVLLYLSTTDACLRAAFSVADTIATMRSPVHVHVTGQVGGAALSILASAQRRTMGRHATLRLAEPQEKFDGTAAELAAREAEHRWLADELYVSLARITGRPVDEIHDDAKRGRLFTPTQAVAYGLIEEVRGLQFENSGQKRTDR